MINYATQSQIKQRIKEELGQISIQYPIIFSDNTIETFIKFLILPFPDRGAKLEGVSTRIPNALVRLLLTDINREEEVLVFPELAKIEPFLRKVLYFSNHIKYNELAANKKGLANYIDSVGINTNNIRLSNANFATVNGMPNFAVHLWRVYELRNIESHQCVKWTRKELAENIESLLIVYIYTVSKHIAILSNLVCREPDVTDYLSEVVANFEKWQQRFVHISGIEKFEEIDIYAIESDNWSDEQETVLREGKIDELRNTISEKTMVVLGDPGMGKSTTLQYMAYRDAKALLAETNPDLQILRIPIYLELKLFSISDTIMHTVVNKLGIDEEKLIEYLINGKITLFLDGLNEVLSEMRKPIRNDIKSLIENYPQTRIIVTSRPLAYYSEFNKTPVFVLQRMEDLQIEEFLQKNCQHILTRTIIYNEVKMNARLGKIVRIPLLLKMLVNVVFNNKGVIPDNKAQIIKNFIQNLYERETKKISGEVDFRIIHRLLCNVGYSTRKTNGSNVGWKIEELEAVIEDRIEKSRFHISVFEFLDFALDLNILVKDDNKYSFIHELYQEYYASEELYRINVKNG